jgi:SAM-dependent methyltransferase
MGLTSVIRGEAAHRHPTSKRWRVWDLEAELRYMPVVARLPDSALPICEVGSGPQGIALWTEHSVIGVDPGGDERHGDTLSLPNFRRVGGDGANIPLADRSVAATIAVDTFEHIPATARATVIREMARVTVDGGLVVLMGPSGSAAADGDHQVLERWRERDPDGGIVTWLTEHEELGLPSRAELVEALLETERVELVRATGVYNITLWLTTYRALLGDFWKPPGERFVHHLMWAPFAFVARRYRRGPFYRQLIVAQLGSAA